MTTIHDYISSPGEILLEEFLEPLGISQYRLAKAIGRPQSAASHDLSYIPSTSRTSNSLPRRSWVSGLAQWGQMRPWGTVA